MDFGQGRVHHQDQADGDGDVGGANRDRVVESFNRSGEEVTDPNPNRHGQENPQGQVAVKGG